MFLGALLRRYYSRDISASSAVETVRMMILRYTNFRYLSVYLFGRGRHCSSYDTKINCLGEGAVKGESSRPIGTERHTCQRLHELLVCAGRLLVEVWTICNMAELKLL